MENKYVDVLIVGSGVAGLYSALNIRDDLDVMVVSKDKIDCTNTSLAQGGISVARDVNDVPYFIEDTLKAGQYKNDVQAVKVLTKEGIKTNVTLVFSATQALLAARAGATYVSPFLGRLDDISTPGMDLIRTIAEIFAVHGIETEIIAASVRNPIHVIDAALAGADIATVPTKVVNQMLKHPLTDQGIEKFKKDWEATFGK